ncbi:hypothetical protein SO802_011392 [Lithocarpus litseifolius]|uniref:DBC1/CARP1 catalytically inactive NUDIX hydrolase domain-containing protein n=1 Tax=Lithocarpus litseifolius TaxID=425828 RepID=A0AAW2D572_9ROSI
MHMHIHYDRLGKDGLFSHKEVTVLFVPDFSECLPSLDAWRDQWLAHKKAVAERERQLSLKKEVPAGKTVQNEGTEDKPKDNSDPSSAAVVEEFHAVQNAQIPRSSNFQMPKCNNALQIIAGT